ncbi:MAG: class II fructose-bisphosphate aldolase family protein [Planctomycetes bacterium]|nr:class II fructose-bisphosphate aldolase family protein [Planctomycetota bacterium]
MKELLNDAYRNRYAVPAFNFETFDLLFGIFDGAVASKSPLIVQITESSLEFLGVDNVVAVVTNEAVRRSVPTALHLDHCSNIHMIEQCVNAGFTSVMIDYSNKTFEDNVTMTKRVIGLASPKDVTVESEIGVIGSASDMKQTVVPDHIEMTDPDMALRFYEETHIDALAVAVGSVHGMKVKEKRVDFQRLARINNLLGIPLVLHGCSGLATTDLKNSINEGVTKANIATELRVTFREALVKHLRNFPDEIKARNIMSQVRISIKEIVIAKQHLLGCAGRAC